MASVEKITSGIAIINPGSTITNVSITAIEIDKSFLKITWYSNTGSSDMPSFHVGARIASSTQLQFERIESNGTINIAWELVEFSDGVKVQHGQSITTTGTANATIAAVDLNKSFIFHTLMNNGGINFGTDDNVRARFSSNTTLEFTYYSHSNTITIDWQVIEYDNCSVQQIDTTITTANNQNITISPIDASRSFVIGAFYTTDVFMYSNEICQLTFNSSTQLNVARYVTASTNVDATIFVIEFDDNVETLHYIPAFTNDSYLQSITSVNTDYSIINPSQLCESSVCPTFQTDDNMSNTAFRFIFIGSSITNFGNCLSFNGSPECVRLGNSATFNLTNNFTLECWIKPSVVNIDQRMIGSRSDNFNNGIGFGINSSGNLIFTTFGIQDFNSSITITAGVWTHVAVVFTSGNDARFFRNGQFIEQVNGSSAANISGIDMHIGQMGDDFQYFSGLIDEVRMWNIAKTDAEITLNYSKSVLSTTQNLIGYWKFNESTGIIANDETNNNNGTLIGMDDANWVTNDLILDGTSSQVQIKRYNSPSISSTTAFTTIEFSNRQPLISRVRVFNLSFHRLGTPFFG